MKKLICLLCALMLTLGLWIPATVSAAGTVTVSPAEETVTIGDTITITLAYNGGGKGIGSLDAYFHYNAKTFEYLSCNGATANGGGGSVKISYFCQELTAPKKVTITLTFKAIKAGAADFELETEGMYDDEDNLLGTPKKSLAVAANNPTLSGDATLSYLKPLKGTLTPKFDKNVTEYTVSVPYTVTRVTLSYTTTDPNATTSIVGKADLEVGENTRTVTVTAPNGDTKKYTVVITREEQKTTAKPSSTTGTTEPTTTTTLTPIPEDALDVEVNGKKMVVADMQPDAPIPEGFSWDAATINEVEVPAAKQETSGLTLLYLYDKDDSKKGGYYIYDAKEDTFSPFCQMKGEVSVFTARDLPDAETGPVGTVPGNFAIGEQKVTAYLYEDPALADFVVLYLTDAQGESGLYTYDKTDGSIQRYHAVVIEQEPTEPPADEPAADEEPVETEPKKSDFVSFVEQYQQVILICAAAVVAIAILIIVIVVIKGMCTGSKGKH